MRELPPNIIIQFDISLMLQANELVKPIRWPIDDVVQDFFVGMIGCDEDDTLDNIRDYVMVEEEIVEGSGIYEAVIPNEIRDMMYQFLVGLMERVYYYLPEAYVGQYHFVDMAGCDAVLLKRRVSLSSFNRGMSIPLGYFTQELATYGELIDWMDRTKSF